MDLKDFLEGDKEPENVEILKEFYRVGTCAGCCGSWWFHQLKLLHFDNQLRCRKPCARCRKPRARCRKPRATCRKPRAMCRKPRESCRKPRETCRKPRKTCHKPCVIMWKTIPDMPSQTPHGFDILYFILKFLWGLQLVTNLADIPTNLIWHVTCRLMFFIFTSPFSHSRFYNPIFLFLFLHSCL